MQAPLRIKARHAVVPPNIATRIERKAASLERAFDRITKCRVTIQGPPARRKGGEYTVKLDIAVPGKAIVINRRHAENLAVAVREAFDAARRQLEEFSRIRRNDVKRHEETPTGHIVRLFPDEGFGFIHLPEDREVYFHRNSVVEGAFDRLRVGTLVRFTEEQGDQGPQARSVSII